MPATGEMRFGEQVRISEGTHKGKAGTTTRKIPTEYGPRWEVRTADSLLTIPDSALVPLEAAPVDKDAKIKELVEDRVHLAGMVDALQQALADAGRPAQRWEFTRLVHEITGGEYDVDENEELAEYVNAGWEIVQIDSNTCTSQLDGLSWEAHHFQIVTLRREVNEDDDGEKAVAEVEATEPVRVEAAAPTPTPTPETTEAEESPEQDEALPVADVLGNLAKSLHAGRALPGDEPETVLIMPGQRPEAGSLFDRALLAGLPAEEVRRVGDAEILAQLQERREARGKTPRALTALV